MCVIMDTIRGIVKKQDTVMADSLSKITEDTETHQELDEYQRVSPLTQSTSLAGIQRETSEKGRCLVNREINLIK